MIRAKFRCLGINLRWDSSSTIELRPVTRKKYEYGRETMNFAENEKFWKFSPSGDCTLIFKTSDLERIPFRLGSYYYVDMEPAEGGLWKLSQATRYGGAGAGAGEIVLVMSEGEREEYTYATLKIGLSGEGTGAAKVDDFGEPGARWGIAFSLAHDHAVES